MPASDSNLASVYHANSFHGIDNPEEASLSVKKCSDSTQQIGGKYE